MAGVAEVADNDTIQNGFSLDIKSLLSGEERDFLIRSNDDQVKIGELNGKVIGLFFSASWSGPCMTFTPELIAIYKELEIAIKGDFEVVFVSLDSEEKSFEEYFSKMPWLAIPFSDSKTRSKLEKDFKVSSIPHLIIVGKDGKILTTGGVDIASNYGVDGYPFLPERLEEVNEEDEAIRQNQSLRPLLVTNTRGFVISNDNKQIPVSELEGKTIGFYFAAYGHPYCQTFTPELIRVYEKLKENGENFEIVLVSSDLKLESFNKHFSSMPWFALPFQDTALTRLTRIFQIQGFPTLLVVGPDGKTLKDDAVGAIEEHGVEAYPFTPERFIELVEIEKERLKSLNIESLLLTEDRDFVIDKSGNEVPISDLAGKNVCLYFAAKWCHLCHDFMPKLIHVYNDIKARDPNFEIVFISGDQDEASFNDFLWDMPWLALPYGDMAVGKLLQLFKIASVPTLVVVGKDGELVSSNAIKLLWKHGPRSYPFTEKRLKEIKEEVRNWPKHMNLSVHSEHPLVFTKGRWYICDGCNKGGFGWTYYCKKCDYDLHPECALEKKEERANGTS